MGNENWQYAIFLKKSNFFKPYIGITSVFFFLDSQVACRYSPFLKKEAFIT